MTFQIRFMNAANASPDKITAVPADEVPTLTRTRGTWRQRGQASPRVGMRVRPTEANHTSLQLEGRGEAVLFFLRKN